MNENKSLGNFTAVVSLLSSDQRFYSHCGILCEDEIVSLSGSHKSKEYSTTKFESEEAVNEAVFQVVRNRDEILNSIPNSDVAYSIEIDVRQESPHCTKFLYKVKIR